MKKARPFDALPDWVKPREAMEVLRLSRSNVYELLKSGAIAHRRFGRSIRIPKESLLAVAEVK